ncbi:hypothetical protein BDW75DRAFT_229435 [Aspergillus navahoensis]
MTPSILIVGATGNTGRAAAQTLPKSLQSSSALSGNRIIALTRSSSSPVAQALAKLPGVEVIEQDWVFYVNALNAGVKYVVPISTTAANVRLGCPAYYSCQHWAIEDLLDSPDFNNLQWTSLQPNLFSPLYHKTGEQDTIRLMLSEDAPVGIIDPDEVGIIAAYLLSQVDTSVHNKARHVLNGPEDITGKQVVDMIEQRISAPVKDVSYKDVSFVDMMYEHQYAATKQSKNVIYSSKRALETAWEGKCSASTTIKEILELAAPKRTPADSLRTLLEK